MNRQDVKNLALQELDKHKCLVLELATGFGKTSIAIALMNKICDKVWKHENDSTTILIIVAKVVHKQTWLDEIEKWGGLKTDNVVIECYESLHKYKNAVFDAVVLDEAQHLSENRREILETIRVQENLICLSATIKKELKDYLKFKYNAYFITCSIKNAIDNNVLPEPTIYLLALNLDDNSYSYKSKLFSKESIVTQKGYYDNITTVTEYYKSKFFTTNNERFKILWLSTAGKRLKWLAKQKENLVKVILRYIGHTRSLTFCSSVAQAEVLGKYNITSKNKESYDNLEKFNKGIIHHITACSILNEGVNLNNCKVCLFCSLSSSDIVIKQRFGRSLRHKSPIIIIPYFRHTREEEIAYKMIEEYDKTSIVHINNYKQIKL